MLTASDNYIVKFVTYFRYDNRTGMKKLYRIPDIGTFSLFYTRAGLARKSIVIAGKRFYKEN